MCIASYYSVEEISLSIRSLFNLVLPPASFLCLIGVKRLQRDEQTPNHRNLQKQMPFYVIIGDRQPVLMNYLRQFLFNLFEDSVSFKSCEFAGSTGGNCSNTRTEDIQYRKFRTVCTKFKNLLLKYVKLCIEYVQANMCNRSYSHNSLGFWTQRKCVRTNMNLTK